ncbi:MAG TPA: DUF5709 domain-containing protein [Propionibacteriaceae bacterium]|nr:DUF5709 domain-containing protein [Propionibacteriaceae bacterium]
MDAELESIPDESEQLDQLQPGETLIDRGVDDVLDEGYIAPDHWSAAEGFGNTAAEMRQGETLEQRIAQEEPEVEVLDEDWNPTHESRQVGSVRAGRLVDPHGYPGIDTESESVAVDAGLAGGAACAEEAAMHIISDEDLAQEPDR